MEKYIYTIMPFDEAFDVIYYELILRAAEGLIDSPRADQQKHGGCITDKVAESLLNATAVIADLSWGNPNVMYELGIAHSFRKPTILIKNEADPKQYQLPFDIKDQQTLFYKYNPDWDTSKQNMELESARRELRIRIQELMKNNIEAKSPIVHALAGRAAFVDDLSDWLWGYARTYKEEKESHNVWEITADPYWVCCDPLFGGLLIDGVRNNTRRYYFLVPETDKVTTQLTDLINYLKNNIGKAEHEKIEKGFNYMKIEKEFFDLFELPIVIYDAKTPSARGYICEPMAPGIGEELEFDDKVIKDNKMVKNNPEYMFTLPPLERWKEKRFDIRLHTKKLSGLRSAFAKIWNKKIEEEIKKLRSSEDENSKKKICSLEYWYIP